MNYERGSLRVGWSPVAAGAYLDVRPPAPALDNSEEWRVMAIHFPKNESFEVYRTDGTNAEMIASGTQGGLANFEWAVTRDIYLQIKNTSASTVYAGYDAVLAREETDNA